MLLILRATRGAGVVIALGLLGILSVLAAGSLRDSGFTTDFFWRQILGVFLPYAALLILLMVPYSRIRNFTAWRILFFAMLFLSLVWLVPAVHQAILRPGIHVAKPPGEGVAQRILITRSYDELRDVGLIAVFLVTQMAAIWFAPRRIGDGVVTVRDLESGTTELPGG